MRHDAKMVSRVLDLLREVGWQAIGERLQEEVAATDDEQRKEDLRFFAGWMAAERGQFAEARQWFDNCRLPNSACWVLIGRAFIAFRELPGPEGWEQARYLLKKTEQQLASDGIGPSWKNDPILTGTIAHLRGSIAHREGDINLALRELTTAWKMFGPDHFGTGRVFDTFGMVYAERDNFHAAVQFFQQAIEKKKRCHDAIGLALTHGNLGRLYIDWGYPDRAEEHLRQDVDIVKSTRDEWGQVEVFNLQGQLERALGEQCAGAKQARSAQAHFTEALAWLDMCIDLAERNSWAVLAAEGRKERARTRLACMSLGKPRGVKKLMADVEVDLQWADLCFRDGDSREELAHLAQLWGILLRHKKQFVEAVRRLEFSRDHLRDRGKRVEQARAEWELARTLYGNKDPRPAIRAAYLQALASAESCRRDWLVEAIEQELYEIDPAAHAEHIYRRVRGQSVKESTTSLVSGTRETISVMYLDLVGSTSHGKEHDPAEVMLTLNQMMAEFVSVLRKHQGDVSSFRGDGFLALFRGERHAIRAVEAALDLFAELERFNHPWIVLDLEPFSARIGIATGEVCLGNMGTYDKMSFTAIGTTGNRGARVESVAHQGVPCIDRLTHEDVSDRFVYQNPEGRLVPLTGLGRQHVWDVTGPSEKSDNRHTDAW